MIYLLEAMRMHKLTKEMLKKNNIREETISDENKKIIQI